VILEIFLEACRGPGVQHPKPTSTLHIRDGLRGTCLYRNDCQPKRPNPIDGKSLPMGRNASEQMGWKVNTFDVVYPFILVARDVAQFAKFLPGSSKAYQKFTKQFVFDRWLRSCRNS
jgi:hypothetical protein